MGSIPVAPASLKTWENMRRSRFKANFFLWLGVAVCFAVLTAFLLSTDILVNDLKRKPEGLVSFCKISDKDAPVVTLNGESVIYVRVGEDYEELGAEATDDCDAAEIIVQGEVDTNAVGIYNIIYSAEDLSGNRAEARRIVNVVPEYHGTIYLTFDDGPGPYTNELLDVLGKYNVKATFFVTGVGDDELIAREYREGHTVGLHTFSHNYAYIYSGTEEFFDDLYRVQERVRNITGQNMYLMRFPGGSSNTVSRKYDSKTHIMSQLVDEVIARGFTYFDWNVTSGDAGSAGTSEEVIENVTERLIEYGDSIVLQHDIKDFSVAAVEEIIKYGITNGYEFKKLDASSFTAHHGVNN